MPLPVKLSDIVAAIDFQMDEFSSYLNRNTGEIVTISDEEFRAVEDEEPLEDFPEWERENLQIAREILGDSGRVYVQLPTKWDIDEWRMMDRFARWAVEDEQASEELQFAIRGRGAFRMFKHLIHRLGIADQWYEYREQALREIARDWCEANGIPYVED